jgi:hypothetical protein
MLHHEAPEPQPAVFRGPRSPLPGRGPHFAGTGPGHEGTSGPCRPDPGYGGGEPPGRPSTPVGAVPRAFFLPGFRLGLFQDG